MTPVKRKAPAGGRARGTRTGGRTAKRAATSRAASATPPATAPAARGTRGRAKPLAAAAPSAGRGRPAAKARAGARGRAAAGGGAGRAGRPRLVDEDAVAAVVRVLHGLYPEAQTALLHENPLQLLLATILSAQSTDERVNQVTRTLFQKYRSVDDFADADRATMEDDIRPTGFFRNKTKLILGAAQRIRDTYGGRVPDTMAELLTLPGVARKTANVVLGSAFGKAEGVVVDTHIRRLSHRLGLSLEHDPVKVERDLMRRLPREEWIFVGHGLILHGRAVCQARKPRCTACALAEWCPRNGVTVSA